MSDSSTDSSGNSSAGSSADSSADDSINPLDTSSVDSPQDVDPTASPVSADAAVPTHDIATIISLAVIATALATLLHEGLGHGMAAWVLGADVKMISSVHCAYDSSMLSEGSRRLISAAGSFVNLDTGLVAWFLIRGARSATVRYFLWLFAAISLFQAGGYLMVSPLAGFGDWNAFVTDLPYPFLWRLLLTALGVGISFGALFLSLKGIKPFLVRGTSMIPTARKLTWVPYLTGGVVSVLSGLYNPVGWSLVLISAAAASFGGTAWLAWLPFWLKGNDPDIGDMAISIQRNFRWIAAGVVVLLIFIFVLGPGIGVRE